MGDSGFSFDEKFYYEMPKEWLKCVNIVTRK
jgi:hypothetical protein